MHVRSGDNPLQTPEQLDGLFKLVAGLYAAALLSPAVLGLATPWLGSVSWPVTLGLLGAVGAVLAATVAWTVSRQSEFVAWLDSPWIAFLVPAIGILPISLYLFDVFLFVAFAVTDLQPDTAANLIGFVGFVAGIAATLLGEYLVLRARTQLANATVDDTDVAVEWTAGWPRRARLWFMIGTLVVIGLLAGVAFWRLGWRGVTTVLPFGPVLVIALRSVVSERTHRATSVGLERRRDGRWLGPRRLIPWSRVDGFSVTDDAIILHRALPRVDIRCQRNLIDDEAVVAALNTHLDRRDT